MSNLPIVEIALSTWNPADMHRSAPRLNPMHAVDCISSARRDIWSPLTAPPPAISPTSDPCCVSSLYANTILAHNAHTGTHGGISATFTSEKHSNVTFENLSRKGKLALRRPSKISKWQNRKVQKNRWNRHRSEHARRPKAKTSPTRSRRARKSICRRERNLHDVCKDICWQNQICWRQIFAYWICWQKEDFLTTKNCWRNLLTKTRSADKNLLTHSA